MQFFPSSGVFETLFPVIFIIIFCLVVGVILFAIIRGVGQWNKNNHSPRIAVPARVASRRNQTSGGDIGQPHTSVSTWYYATFELETGDRIELQIPHNEFGFIAEGDFGTLTFQGTRFISYVRC